MANGRILLVEDDPDTRLIFSAMLCHEGFHVAQAEDGTSALGRVREEHPDLVVLDLMLPGMTGLEVLRGLRADPETAGVPVIVVSADVDGESAARRIGCEAFLPKPLRPSFLVQTARALLGTGPREEDCQAESRT